MLGKREPQISFSIINIEELIPENHLLKLIDKTVNFKFIYKLMKPYYSEKGRPSIDPVCMNLPEARPRGISLPLSQTS